MRQILRQAMRQPDELVVLLDYIDSKGVASRRVVSPIRFLAKNRFLALCLCREEPRQFYLDRCTNARLGRASDVLMPVPMLRGCEKIGTGTSRLLEKPEDYGRLLGASPIFSQPLSCD